VRVLRDEWGAVWTFEIAAFASVSDLSSIIYHSLRKLEAKYQIIHMAVAAN